MGHRRFASPRRKALGPLTHRAQRKRKSWTFERLEDRLVFSVDAGPQFYSFSSDNPAGAAQTILDELNWAQMAAAQSSANSSATTGATYSPMSLPTDPLFPDPSKTAAENALTQWNLLNIGQYVGNADLQNLKAVPGQDINVVPAWNMVDANGNPITGQGVTVAVIDTGTQVAHPDLADNISPTLRFNSATGSNDVTPDVGAVLGEHGTAIAGIIGAVANNGVGGTGVAPGVTLVPIKASTLNPANNTEEFTAASVQAALQYALENNIDITSNAYGPSGRVATPSGDALFQLLRDAVVQGRGGLGMINIFASGNDAAPNGTQGFPTGGNYNSAAYNDIINSRYVIGVTGVDHDGLYANADGTWFNYANAGSSVLVAAPTGSSVPGITNIGNDQGYGSGVTTTDLVGDDGLNSAPLANGTDPDGDSLGDNQANPAAFADYTSRLNGTSTSAAEVAGVVALMLQANPSLTFRDVEEILVRSSRQNAQFEYPSSAGLVHGSATQSTWQTNQSMFFQNPDPYDGTNGKSIIPFEFPIADPGNTLGGGFFGFGQFAPDTNDGGRQDGSSYEPEPATFTNGAGYTVSQGYGIYGEQIGYGHGVVDADAAVYMALHWNELKQNIAPNTELTYTTGFVSTGTGGSPGLTLPPMEFVADPPNGNSMIIPGGIQSGLPVDTGFNAYWNQYYTDTPFVGYTGKQDTDRGLSYIDFAVPPSQEMSIETVEVKLDIAAASNAALQHLRITLVSPEGTQSELNDYYIQTVAHAPQQGTNASGAELDLGASLNQTDGDFVWTFNTNRSWGENSSSEVLIHPVTGEPVLDQSTGQPIFRNWELHIENYSTTTVDIKGLEVVWHGKPIGGGSYDSNYGLTSNTVIVGPGGVQQATGPSILSSQRVQGFVGIDENGDNQFNYNRYTQTVLGTPQSVTDIRSGEVVRTLYPEFIDNNNNGVFDAGDDIGQEPFAANIVVKAYRVYGGVQETDPVATFLTGADGNYYFDLDPVGDLARTTNPNDPHFGQTFEYNIVATDPLGRLFQTDTDTPALPNSSTTGLTYLPHYQASWTITPDWFYAPDRDNAAGLADNPGEVFYDPTTNAPVPFTDDGNIARVPMPVKNLNFLLKDTLPANQFDVTGIVYSDVDGDGQVNGADVGIPGATVFWDRNGNGVNDNEPTATTGADGSYTLTVDLTTLSPIPKSAALYNIHVVVPTGWTATDPGGDGLQSVYAAPGSPTQIADFYLKPAPSSGGGGGGGGGGGTPLPGTIQGVVFNDVNNNGVQNGGEAGVAGFRVFIDLDKDGVWNSATEPSTIASSSGSYFFNNLVAGVYWVDVVIPNENTATANWSLNAPVGGHNEVQVNAGGSLTGVSFACATWPLVIGAICPTRSTRRRQPMVRATSWFRVSSWAPRWTARWTDNPARPLL